MIRRKYYLGPICSIEYLYTLEELFTNQGSSINITPSLADYKDLNQAFNTDYWLTGKGWELWTYIFANNRDHICMVSDEEAFDKSETRSFWVNFWKIWTNTHVYYEKLIDLMATKENQLLDKLVTVSESESRFNDTPDTSGTHDTSDYTSNLSKGKNTITSDAGTALERLEEVRRKYNDYYNLWAKEFDRLFVSELNYQATNTLSEDI